MRRFEVQLQRFFQVGESLLFGLALAGDVDLEALRNVPVPFAPNCSGKRSLHDHIQAQEREIAGLFLRKPHLSGLHDRTVDAQTAA